MIAGIDIATAESHVVRRLDGEHDAMWRRLRLPDRKAFAEKDALLARDLADVVPDGDFWEGVWLAGIEYPFTMTMGSVVLKTILGAWMALIPKHVTVVPLPARLWTPWFLRENVTDPLPKVPRKSAERKPLIKAHALALLDSDDIWPQDAYDAYGISLAVERMNHQALVRSARPAPAMRRPA